MSSTMEVTHTYAECMQVEPTHLMYHCSSPTSILTRMMSSPQRIEPPSCIMSGESRVDETSKSKAVERSYRHYEHGWEWVPRAMHRDAWLLRRNNSHRMQQYLLARASASDKHLIALLPLQTQMLYCPCASSLETHNFGIAQSDIEYQLVSK